MALKFVNLAKGESPDASARDVFYLVYNDWDDWFEFETKYRLQYFAKNGDIHFFGFLKIGSKGLTGKERRAPVPQTFSKLGSEFFSVGQDEDYYKSIHAAGLADKVFPALRDMAYDLAILEKYRTQSVAKTSLFRSIDEGRIKNRFHRLSKGDFALSDYNFSYTFPARDKSQKGSEPVLSFAVSPGSTPPTNIHVLIGRNGVGKTTCMNNMTKAFLETNENKFGEFDIESLAGSESFSNLISVTFSAFDPFFTEEKKKDGRYAYVGLKRALSASEGKGDDADKYTLKTPADLDEEFVSTALKCRTGVKKARWEKALGLLSSDPLFAEAEVQSLCDDFLFDEDDWKEDAEGIFKGLSSGHKIVLLTISRLVELVQEQSLVLLDEPEGHLHPPLLSAFIRALSSLLIDQNGVAIVATHSPVVLQEVPKSCVWILNRSGRTVVPIRPAVETFGENVGTLTHEVFGLEVTDTGFHKLIKTLITEKGLSYDQLLSLFNNQVGSEGMAIANAIAYLSRDAAE
jgi:predicted ATPase